MCFGTLAPEPHLKRPPRPQQTRHQWKRNFGCSPACPLRLRDAGHGLLHQGHRRRPEAQVPRHPLAAPQGRTPRPYQA